MKQFATLARCDYRKVSLVLANVFDGVAMQFTTALTHGSVESVPVIEGIEIHPLS